MNAPVGSPEVEDTKRDSHIARHNRLYAEWLHVRAKTHEEPSDDERGELLARQHELERLIIGAPTEIGYLLLRKVEVLELAMSEGSNWTDQREIAMLGGIKADLVRILGD